MRRLALIFSIFLLVGFMGVVSANGYCYNADINRDGVVDIFDYNIWYDNNGKVCEVGKWCDYADINRDKQVTGADFSAWKAKNGSTGCVALCAVEWADVNQDGIVTETDKNLVNDAWVSNTYPGGCFMQNDYCDYMDVNRDGAVNVADRAMVQAWTFAFIDYDCSRVDVNNDGRVTPSDYSPVNNNIGMIGCSESNNWCSKTDISHNAQVDSVDMEIIKQNMNCIYETEMCTDSDNGLNYYVKGTVTTSDGSISDSCDGNRLTEWICDAVNGEHGIDDEYFDCPNGCSNGACITGESNGTAGKDLAIVGIEFTDPNFYVLGDNFNINPSISQQGLEDEDYFWIDVLVQGVDGSEDHLVVADRCSTKASFDNGKLINTNCDVTIDEAGEYVILVTIDNLDNIKETNEKNNQMQREEVIGVADYSNPFRTWVGNLFEEEMSCSSLCAKYGGSVVEDGCYGRNFEKCTVSEGTFCTNKGVNTIISKDYSTACCCEVSNIDGCVSSDGINPFVKGSTKDAQGNVYEDSCDGNKVIDYYCGAENNVYSFTDLDCPNGCENGACKRTMISPDDFTGPIDTPEVSDQVDYSYDSFVCNGCVLDKKCYPFGYRKSDNYCSDSMNWVEQKLGDKSCDNNFECDSNVCVSGQCVESGLMQRIINWFRKLFG